MTVILIDSNGTYVNVFDTLDELKRVMFPNAFLIFIFPVNDSPKGFTHVLQAFYKWDDDEVTEDIYYAVLHKPKKEKANVGSNRY